MKQGTEIITIDDEAYETVNHYEHQWWYIKDSKGNWLHCAPNHWLYDNEGYPRQAQDFEIGDIIRHRTGDFEVVESDIQYREGWKVQVIMSRIHLYWANGFLSRT